MFNVSREAFAYPGTATDISRIVNEINSLFYQNWLIDCISSWWDYFTRTDTLIGLDPGGIFIVKMKYRYVILANSCQLTRHIYGGF